MRKTDFYQKSGATFAFNPWDVFALLMIFCAFGLLAWGAMQMSKPFNLGEQVGISLAVRGLPFYAVESVLRMLLAMLFSLLFTFTIGTLAAKNKHAQRIIIPFIDILQSVPVLGYLSITITAFIALFPGSLWGPEACCIFVIFTAQVWNMTLGFYQSLRTLPPDLVEAARMFNLTPWQRFWRVEVSFAMPNLLWNMMMSMSQSWVFLTLSEAISVANQNIRLPGIGSYIYVAIEQANLHAILYAIITMFIVIVIYDQLMFRPILKWAEKFRADASPDERPTRAWFTSLLQRARLIHYFGHWFSVMGDAFINMRWTKKQYIDREERKTNNSLWFVSAFYGCLAILLTVTLYFFGHFIFSTLGWHDVLDAVLRCLGSAARVSATVLISSLVWIPVGVWIGRNPNLTKIAQPIVQFCASFPANLIYPLAVVLIIKFDLNVNIWVTGLMILGAQWYILFNVISGTATLPKEIYYAAQNFNVRGWLWWKRVILPGIFPYYITGAITASGGAWNLTIVTEFVSWGNHTFMAYGLGSYIAQYTNSGDFHRVALGIGIMCIFVLLFNWILWRPLYNLAQERFKIT